jgi:hypothetical protein
MCDSAGVKRLHAVNLVITEIRSCNMILGMAWLQKQNPNLNWDLGVWHWRTRTDAEDRPIRLVSASAFVAIGRAEGGYGYELHLANLDQDGDTTGDVLIATGPEPTVLEAFETYGWVFPEVD